MWRVERGTWETLVVKLGCPIISWQRRFINFESLHPQHCLEDILLGAKFFFQFKPSISHVGCLKSHERIYKAIQISVWDACSKCRSTKLDTWVLVPLFQGWSTWTKLEYKIAVLWQKSSLKFLLWKSAAGKRTKNDHELCFLFDRENDSCSLQDQLKMEINCHSLLQKVYGCGNSNWFLSSVSFRLMLQEITHFVHFCPFVRHPRELRLGVVFKAAYQSIMGIIRVGIHSPRLCRWSPWRTKMPE